MNEPRVVESVTNECQSLGRAHESSSARAEQLIACLEGEIAKRDEELAACRVAVENCDLFRARIAELEARIVWLECEAQVNAAPVSEAKAQGVALDGSQLAGLLEQVRLDDDEAKPHGSGAAYWNNAVIACQVAIRDALAAPVQQVSVPDDEAVMAKARELFGWAYGLGGFSDAVRDLVAFAHPAAPAADAGIVDMYRHLQKVTPYRFKKIQDASITDGGDVMYFHKDRFDAALLADMAAHCAAKGVV